MFDKGSYLREREFLKEQGRQCKQESYDYWSQLLGEDVCEKLKKYSPNFKHYLADENFHVIRDCEKEEDCDSVDLWNCLKRNDWELFCCPVSLDFMDQVTFGSFYKPILLFAIDSLSDRLKENLNCDRSGMEEWISDNVLKDFAVGCTNRLQNICARTLIVRMHECKQDGKLQGSTPQEEYTYFCSVIAGTPGFMTETFERFPVLYRMVWETVKSMVAYYAEVIRYYREEYSTIREQLSLKQGEKKIIKIQGDFADTHNHGRQVLKIKLDRGTDLIYKPHSMDNEKVYECLYDWISGSMGLDSFHYGFLSCPDHSWCSVIHRDTCASKEQIERYYERFGIHLFLSYLLGTKDLHFENLIATGEYPVLIDLEALVNIYYSSGERTIKEEVLSQLSQSVLYSGLLPYYHWNQSGTGVDNSALSGKKGQKYPFQVPVIVNDKTSDMRIEYRNPVSGTGDNLASLNGEYQDPCKYQKNILAGFEAAYRVALDEKEELEKLLHQIKGTTSRYLVADTQRYAMALASSCHPGLLTDGAERELFLNIMWMGRDDADHAIVDKEVESMLRGDIPLFYYRTDELALYSDGRIVLDHYFEKTACDCIGEKRKLLSEEDLEKQCTYIRLSLDMMDEEKRPYLNQIYPAPAEEKCEQGKEKLLQRAEGLMKRILSYAVWNQDHTKVSWHTVRFDTTGKVTWELVPMNMYLYDGLAGMLLIFAAWGHVCKGNRKELFCQRLNREAEQVTEVLKKMLFDYTDRGQRDMETLNSRKTGAYEGEASIVYTYLCLYRMTECNEYLFYAQKHADLVGHMLGNDECYDLLSGNAGAAHVLLMLYHLTGERKYMEQAEYAIGILEKNGGAQEKGIGWIVDKDTPPMSGMAHGNAGILMPVMTLWALTGEAKYGELAEQIWEYEDSLFNSRIGNWDDVRMERNMGDGIGAVSWCHGAPGILLSRIYCCGLTADETWRRRFLCEIRIGYDKLKQYWKRDSWCLCHGNCGNLWILEIAEQFLLDTGELKDGTTRMAEKMRDICLSEELSYLPQEMLNPGMFNGYGGILCYFLACLDQRIKGVVPLKPVE